MSQPGEHGPDDDRIELGTMLFTLVEPHPGHEVAYHRWYERDHFYAGCMIGPFNFAGQRWVATRPLKERRYPEGSPITPDPTQGSYLAVYFVLAGHHDEWNRWAVDQVNKLHANGRMFTDRDHIHTALYRYEWAVSRDPDGVPPELALDHRFGGLVAVVGEAAEGVEVDEAQRWMRAEHVPAVLGDSAGGGAGALCLGFSPMPLLADAPGDVPREDDTARRFMQLWFLDTEPEAAWETFESLGPQVEAGGKARLVWVAPFLPTVPGTDTYTDQLS